MSEPRLRIAGESALIAYLGEASSPEVSARVQALQAALREHLGELLVDLIPSYASLLVLFDPLRTDHAHIGRCIRQCARRGAQKPLPRGRLVSIAVYYHPESGEDLRALGERAGIAWREVAELHQRAEYRVYAIGFAPGFAYLGDVDARLAAPRRATPRPRVPRGAVAIADRQTAVYPAASPGGWNLIGRSPRRMFDPAADDPVPLRVGDRVRFESITRDRYLALGGEL